VDKLRDNHAVIELDYLVPDKAARQTTSQLKSWLKRFVARNATDAVAARAELERRSVWVDHQDDGMSLLHAYIRTTDAVRIDQLLTGRAKQTPADNRTRDQRRADEFVRGMFATGEKSTGSHAVIGVTVPVTSLAELSDEPGVSFDGQFALRRSSFATSPRSRARCSTALSPTPSAGSSTSPSSAGSPHPNSGSRSRLATAPAGSPPAPDLRWSPTSTTRSRTPDPPPDPTSAPCAGAITT
jgi:hypothetical protein